MRENVLVVPVCGLALYLNSKEKKEINLKIICHHKNKAKKLKYLLPGKATYVLFIFYEVEVDYNRRGRWLVQSGKVLTTKPDYLSSIPGTHTWKERTNSRKLYSQLSTYCGVQLEKTVASNFLFRL